MNSKTKIEQAKQRLKVRMEGYQHCPNAPKGLYTARDKEGNMFIAGVSCRKENCEVCGREGSALHRQRISRWASPVLWIAKQSEYLGYLVVTVPMQYRGEFKDKKRLKEFRTFIKRKLQREGARYGKMRYHWAGEKGGVYNPHLNILFGSGGWIEEEVLNKWKKDIAKWLGYKSKKGIVLEYRYAKSDDTGFMWHKIRYIARPTLLLIKGEKEREEIWFNVVNDFVNDVEFGNPDDIDLKKFTIEELREMYGEIEREKGKNEAWVVMLILGYSPVTFEKLHWKWRRAEITKNGIYWKEWFTDEKGRIECLECHISGDMIKHLGMGFYLVITDTIEAKALCGAD